MMINGEVSDQGVLTIQFTREFRIKDARYLRCGLCGAVVPDEDEQFHTSWHANLIYEITRPKFGL